MENLRFASKVDPWIRWMLFVPPIGAAVSGFSLIAHGQYAFGLAPLVLVAAVYVGLVLPIYYEVAPEALVIRFGLVRLSIPYADIAQITPSSSVLSSPALSMDRLQIERRSKAGPLISPADRAGFLKAVAARAPHLMVQGDSLKARPQAG